MGLKKVSVHISYSYGCGCCKDSCDIALHASDSGDMLAIAAEVQRQVRKAASHGIATLIVSPEMLVVSERTSPSCDFEYDIIFDELDE